MLMRLAIALAVSGWSPVTMTTLTPRCTGEIAEKERWRETLERGKQREIQRERERKDDRTK